MIEHFAELGATDDLLKALVAIPQVNGFVLRVSKGPTEAAMISYWFIFHMYININYIYVNCYIRVLISIYLFISAISNWHAWDRRICGPVAFVSQRCVAFQNQKSVSWKNVLCRLFMTSTSSALPRCRWCSLYQAALQGHCVCHVVPCCALRPCWILTSGYFSRPWSLESWQRWIYPQSNDARCFAEGNPRDLKGTQGKPVKTESTWSKSKDWQHR